jgi:photosystem II stability/assembly factor-like uncharacterized protein
MYYSFSTYIFFICSLLVLQSCTSNPSDPFNPQNGSFDQEQVEAETATLNAHDNLLLAGTTEGAFKKQLNNSSDWNQAGLQIDSSTVVDFIIWDEVEMLAAVRYDSVRQHKPTLFKSNDSGTSWDTVDVTKPKGYDYFVVHFLELLQSLSSKDIIAYAGTIIQSTDKGKSWSTIYKNGFFSEFLSVSPYHPNQIWTGGWTSIFSPYLAKSEDSGKTWTLLNENVHAGDANSYDVVLHPNDADQVLVGMGGAVSNVNRIRKSTDGGQNWQNVLQGYNIRTLTHKAQNPEMVYASGINAQGTLFFAASGDFGESWDTVEWEDSPAGVQINDMVSVMEDGREVLYFGTNKGVFSYTFNE